LRQFHFTVSLRRLELAKLRDTRIGFKRKIRGAAMAGGSIPHFQNDAGHALIEIGVKEFMCVGANPPFDHPHVFLDMGATTKRSAPIARRSTGMTPTPWSTMSDRNG
jgi:uncharacterized Zn-finger protein